MGLLLRPVTITSSLRQRTGNGTEDCGMRLSTRKRAWLGAALVGLVVSLALMLAPSPIDAVALLTPSAAPLEKGDLRLRSAELVRLPMAKGPEDVLVREDGSVLTGVEDGRVLSVKWGSPPIIETLATTNGRPFGLAASGKDLWIADGTRGLIRMDEKGGVQTVAKEIDGAPFRFLNSVVAASDGAVYFTDSSTKYGPLEYLYELFEARPTGRLLKFDPKSRATTVLLSDIFFSNGVALSAQEDFLVVAETYRYRVLRYWLKGPRAGQLEEWASNLPGFPDGISRGEQGNFWLALYTTRNGLMDMLHRSPFAKNQLAKLPPFFWPKPAPHGIIVSLDESGRLTRSFQDPGGEKVREVTVARERDGMLYFGTLHGDWIGRFRIDGQSKR